MKKNKKKKYQKKQSVRSSQQVVSRLLQRKSPMQEPTEYMLMDLAMGDLGIGMDSLAVDLRDVRENAELVCDFMHTLIDRIDDLLEMIDDDDCDDDDCDDEEYDEDDIDPFDMEDDDE